MVNVERILVVGGGIIGLSTAMMLARQGFEVTVLEHDREPVPDSPEEAWTAWQRRGVAQFRQPHYLQVAGHQILDRYLPEVNDELLKAGGTRFDLIARIPSIVADRKPRPGDERFVTVTGRRPILEYAVAQAAERLVPVVRGVEISGLLTDPSMANGTSHVTGVRTVTGESFPADIVIDATGRRSKLLDWLAGIGARRPIEEAAESGFIYYTRFFRSTTGEIPVCRAGILTHYHSFSLLTLPGDGQTWSVTVFIYAGDPALKALRDPGRWTALVQACPLHAHWLDGEPITDVLAMGGITNRYRRFIVDGAPVATGIVSVGDAWACTNPIGGRGITMGLMHALGTTEVVRDHRHDPVALALAHDAMTESRVTPWYRHTVGQDHARISQINAVIQGRNPAPPANPESALFAAMLHDADLFRAAMEIISLLALPDEVLARPGVAGRIMEIATAHEPPVLPGPSRDELLQMVA